ncbi:COX assembly mitochondrial protein homolog isoform X2 [Apis florea]|uniref:COX assembly mitochondrial protein homolog isoform X2 n=1 Tax=Apis florea TaxID=7463 RepID=UPI000629A39D|nr:COX assembly mitochondrial protein homolog isoform X2 [Apis florea]
MKEVKNSDRPKYGGGPHNLGDPEDKFLRKVEKDILIPQKMRDKAKQEKCIQEVQEFNVCCKNASYLMPFKCKKENTALIDCLSKWYNDPKFKEECTQEYLEERSEYRRTGIPKKSKLGRVGSSN